MSKMKLLLDVVQDLRTLAASLETLANAISDPDTSNEPSSPKPQKPQMPPPQEAAADESKLTIVELRAFVAERSTPENRPRIKAILSAHGVNKLTELNEDQYDAVMREVAAL